MPAADRTTHLSGNDTEKVGAGDTARAETELPLSRDELSAFLAGSELLFRLNPHVAIERWEPEPGGFRLVANNELNGCRLETTVHTSRSADGPVFAYADGLKQRTEVLVEVTPEGARLVVIEHYPRIDDEQDPRVAEVDRSLVPWLAAIRRHLLARRRWGWLPGWRWWNERFLPGMPPRQRRIVRLIVWVSVIEFVVFLGLVVVLRYAA